MNVVLSILAALVMAFNLGGGAMAKLDAPVNCEVKATLNTESLKAVIPGAGDETQSTGQILKLAADILDNVSFTATTDQQAAELALKAGEDMVLSLGVRNAEDGITLATSLAEGLALNLSPETVKSLQDQMTSEAGMSQVNEAITAVQGLDREKLTNALLERADHAVEAVKEKAGEAETGSFSVDEFEFTTKAAAEMTDQEFMTLMLNEMKEYAGQEDFTKLYELMGESNNPLKAIDDALEKVKNRPEDEAYDTTVTLYGNEDGEYYVAADLHQDATAERKETAVHLGFGTEFKWHRLNAEIAEGETAPSYLSASILNAKESQAVMTIVDPTSGQEVFINLVSGGDVPPTGVAGVRTGGMFIRAILDAEAAEERTGYHVRILLTNEAEETEEPQDLELATFDVSWGKGGAITSVFDGDGVKTIAIEQLIQGENQDDMAQLTASAMGGVMKALSTLVAHLPEESAAMMNGLLQGMMGVPAGQ